MLQLLADENLNGELVTGLRRRWPQIDLLRVQDVGLRTRDDRTILEWAAEHERILLSHDISTIPVFASNRLISGQTTEVVNRFWTLIERI